MREIKFRVWSNPNMRYVQDEDDYYVRSDGQFVEISLGDMFNELNTDRFIFEQYTGIKDKNSKEIYEGDILRSGSAVMVVVFKNLGLRLKRIDINHYHDMILATQANVEIIGNIHQNSELLNEK